MTDTINRQVKLARWPDFTPVEDDFEIAESPVPQPGPGQVLCRTRYLSLDPYMRSQIAGRHMSGTIKPGDVMKGETVCEVVRADGGEFSPGQLVRCFAGWQEYSVHDSAALSLVSPDIQPPSYALSLLGMTGLTAYAGIAWIADVKAGDKVLMPAVTGGVGAAAAQFCTMRGATVIGMAGGPEKCAYAMEKLGVAACIDRKSDNIVEKLDELFPEGIDVYFDLIGGELLVQVSERLAINARVILAGLMSEYNSTERAPGPPPGFWIRARAQVTGLVVYDFESRRDEFIADCLPALQAGELFQLEDMVEGIEAAPAAFCRLMHGGNFGKLVVDMN